MLFRYGTERHRDSSLFRTCLTKATVCSAFPCPSIGHLTAPLLSSFGPSSNSTVPISCSRSLEFEWLFPSRTLLRDPARIPMGRRKSTPKLPSAPLPPQLTPTPLRVDLFMNGVHHRYKPPGLNSTGRPKTNLLACYLSLVGIRHTGHVARGNKRNTDRAVHAGQDAAIRREVNFLPLARHDIHCPSRKSYSQSAAHVAEN